MKTKKEQSALKEKEVEAEGKERQKLTEDELAQVTGGLANPSSTNPYDSKSLVE